VSSSLRTCETTSAMKRMLASKRAEVESRRDSRTGEFGGSPGSMRWAMKGALETGYGIPAEPRCAMCCAEAVPGRTFAPREVFGTQDWPLDEASSLVPGSMTD